MNLPPTLYRESLIAHMDAAGISAAELARQTGVAKTKIDKLRQRVTVDTTVTDAIKMAHHFGKTMEEFMGLAARADRIEGLMVLLRRLSPEQERMLAAQIQGLLKMQG